MRVHKWPVQRRATNSPSRWRYHCVRERHQGLFANRTPWDTFWKEDEDVLGKRLQKMTSRVTAPPERTIYNFHCQPYGSGLDEAPELTEDLCPEDAGRSIGPVSSKGVRVAIEDGQLLGAVVNLNGENKVKRFVLTSG